MSTKILVAEDDFITCRALEKNIEDWGYNVVTAKNGEEAWSAIKKEGIRLAVLDWVMPGIDGVEICRKIRREYKKEKSKYIYIILLTGKDQHKDIIAGLTGGADDYMTKPFNFSELKARIQNGMRIIELENDRIKLSCHDILTRLWNKNKIIEILDKELNRGKREYQPTGIIKLDIDHFKKINTSFGPQIGDAVLIEVASRLKNNIRRYDEIGRIGGDEMLVVLSNCSLSSVKQIAKRLRLAVCEKTVKTESGHLNISISLGGMSSKAFPQSTKQMLLKECDKTLSLAKKQGYNHAIIVESSHIPIQR